MNLPELYDIATVEDIKKIYENFTTLFNEAFLASLRMGKNIFLPSTIEFKGFSKKTGIQHVQDIQYKGGNFAQSIIDWKNKEEREMNAHCQRNHLPVKVKIIIEEST